MTPRVHRDVLREDCSVQPLPERHERMSLAPTKVLSWLLHWQPNSIHLFIFNSIHSFITKIHLWCLSLSELSCQVGTQGSSWPQILPKGVWLEQDLLFFTLGCSLYLPDVLHYKVKHLLFKHGKAEKPVSENKIWSEKCICWQGVACNQGGWEPGRGIPALRPLLGNVLGKPCLPQMVKYLTL